MLLEKVIYLFHSTYKLLNSMLASLLFIYLLFGRYVCRCLVLVLFNNCPIGCTWFIFLFMIDWGFGNLNGSLEQVQVELFEKQICGGLKVGIFQYSMVLFWCSEDKGMSHNLTLVMILYV